MLEKVVEIINNYYISLGRGFEGCMDYVSEREIVAQREVLRAISREITNLQKEENKEDTNESQNI